MIDERVTEIAESAWRSLEREGVVGWGDDAERRGRANLENLIRQLLTAGLALGDTSRTGLHDEIGVILRRAYEEGIEAAKSTTEVVDPIPQLVYRVLEAVEDLGKEHEEEHDRSYVNSRICPRCNSGGCWGWWVEERAAGRKPG